jgi:hypothetical protein
MDALYQLSYVGVLPPHRSAAALASSRRGWAPRALTRGLTVARAG